MATDFDPNSAVLVGDDGFDPSSAMAIEDFDPTSAAPVGVPRGTTVEQSEDPKPRLRREAFRMMNDAGRLSPRYQRDVADGSSGVIGGTLREGKGVLGDLVGAFSEAVTNPFTEQAEFAALDSLFGASTGGKVAEDLRVARDKPPGWGNPAKTKEVLDGFVKFFEGNGITDGKEMMAILKDSVAENTWDPTTDDNARVLSDGTLRVNPKFVALPDANQGIAAINAANVPQEVKDAEIANFRQARKLAAAEFNRKAKSYDKDYLKHAEQKKAEGVTDPEQVFYSWPGLNRNWIEGSWDVVRDTVANAGRGITNTGRAAAMGVAGAFGAEGAVEGLGRDILASREKQGFVQNIAAARGQEGPVTGTGKELGTTLLEMGPMFAGGGIGRIVGGAAEAGAARQILGKALAGSSVYGYAGAQGYGSLMQTALEQAEAKAAAELRELTGKEINDTVEQFQGAALANGFQTAVLAKLLPEGAEKTALQGLTAQAGTMTGREVLGALRQKYGADGLRAAVLATKPELVEFAKQAYRAGKAGFKDEAVEEGVNQYLEGIITKASGADADKTWDEIGQETFKGAWMGGAIGGGLPVAQQTLAQRAPGETAARDLIAGADAAVPGLDSVAAAAEDLESSPEIELDEKRLPPLEEVEPPVAPVPEVQEETTAERNPVEEAQGLGGMETQAPAAVEGRPIKDELADLSKKWVDQGVRFDLDVTDFSKPNSYSTGDTEGAIKLDLIKVPEDRRRQGLGSKAINDLKALADAIGRPIELFPTVEDTGLPEFYEGLGFTRYKRSNPANGRPRQDGFRYTPQTAPDIFDELSPEPITPETNGPIAIEPELRAGDLPAASAAEEAPREAEGQGRRQEVLTEPGSAGIPADPNAYSPENLATVFDLTPEQAQATDTLVRAMGLDTSQILLKKGGKPGGGLDQSAKVIPGIKGSFEVLADSGKMLLRGLSNPDVSTGIHEITHVARKTLFSRETPVAGITPEDIEVAEAWSGAQDGKWDNKAEEKFARGFEKYLRDGEAPVPELRAVFAKIADWFRNIYRTLAGSPLDLQITPAMRRVFDSLVTRGELPTTPPAPEVVEPAPAPEPETPVSGELPTTSEPDTTSTKNAATDEELARMGFDPIAAPAKKALGTSWDEALAITAADADAGTKLVEELNANPRALRDDVENGVLLAELAKRKAAFGKAQQDFMAATESGDTVEAERQQRLLDDARGKAYEAITAAKLTGTAWGRSGRFRQLAIDEDYSLLAMENRFVTEANGGKPPTEAQLKEIKDLHDRIAKAEAELEEFRTKEAERIFKAEQDARKKAKPQIRKALGSKLGDARKRLQEQGFLAPDEPAGEFLAQESLPEQTLEDLGTFGASWMVDGDPGLRNFTNRVKRTFGDLAVTHAEAIYAKAKEILNTAADAAVQPDDAPAKGKSKEDILDGIEDVPTGNDIFQLARIHINAGVEGFENVMAAVLADLQPVFPEITLREVHDAYSGYGKTVFPSKKEDLVKLREYRQLARLTSQLEDAASKIAPKRTGVQRDKASERVRTLQKEVKEMMRKMGIEATDSKRLATSLDAVKNRLKNEIEELDAAIASKTPKPEAGAPPAYDAEATALKEQRDARKAEYDTLFPKPGKTEDDLIDEALKSLDRRIAAEEKLVRAGLSKRPVAAKDRDVWSKDISERRTRLKELGEQRKALRDAEAERLERNKKLVQSRITKIRERLEKGDYAPAVKKDPVVADKELEDLQLEEFQAKRALNEKILEARLADRSKLEKFRDTSIDLVSTLGRALMTSFDLGHFGRQGGLVNFARPEVTVRNFKNLFTFSENAADKVQMNLEGKTPEEKARFKRAKDAGLGLTEWKAGHKLNDMEELFRSRIAKKIPGVAASERAYVSYMNALRFDYFNTLAKALPQPTKENLAELANHVNNLTGRGSLGRWENSANLLATILFSPKYWSSRLRVAGNALVLPLEATARAVGLDFRKKEIRDARRIIAKEYGRMAIGGTAFYSLIGLAAMMAKALADDEDEKPLFTVGTDPTSSDFGKLVFRNGSRQDPMAGMSQNIVLLSRLISGTSTNTAGKVSDLDEDPQNSRLKVLGRMARSKLAPIPASLVNVLDKQDTQYQPTRIEKELLGLYLPISAAETVNGFRELGVAGGTAAALSGFFGQGVNTYGEGVEDKDLREDILTGVFQVNPERYEK